MRSYDQMKADFDARVKDVREYHGQSAISAVDNLLELQAEMLIHTLRTVPAEKLQSVQAQLRAVDALRGQLSPGGPSIPIF